MPRTARTEKENTHTMMIVFPGKFWDELMGFYENQTVFATYTEMGRHLMKVGLETLKKEVKNGRKSDSQFNR
jgi:predicted  nucleic acid-binding Zn-ribbon protein